ncbi:MFS transporter [Streptomyces sp. NBC_00568]|uniref:MFS transporter n=1 Tax=Streptomyces sp. NBC_00568 TaxID=2975779 RepID=UPI0022509FFD|nr:MFS transporter [Streptomyces sp. NBC_00568]MCX4993620.1 transporter [Streptomyces sp. NBC_00568]
MGIPSSVFPRPGGELHSDPAIREGIEAIALWSEVILELELPLLQENTGHPTRREGHELGYWQLLRGPFAARLLTSTLVGRLPNGMAPTALLLAAGKSGSLAFGSLLAGVYLVAYAAGQPLLGRVADRRGPARTVLVGAGLATAALAAIGLLGTGDTVLTLVLTIVAGVANPPLEAVLRTLWPVIVPVGRDEVPFLRTAYALDSGTQEAVYVVGPLLAAGLVACSPSLALIATAALGLAGALSLACSAPAQTLRPVALKQGHWLGPLQSSAVRVALIAIACAGVSNGAMRVAAVVQADEHRAGWMEGAMPAVLALSGVVGSLVYGTRSWPASKLRQSITMAAVMAVAYIPFVVGVGPVPSVLLITVPGIFFGVYVCTTCLILLETAPPGTSTEAFGWMIAAYSTGLAVGSTLGGLTGGTYLLVMAGPVVTALVLVAGIRWFKSADAKAPMDPASLAPGPRSPEGTRT